MDFIKSVLFLSALVFVVSRTHAAPALISYQGRIAVDGIAFDGVGQFKFALVNASATEVYWSNSADTNVDGQPDHAVSLAVSKGLYSINIGDTGVVNMAALPPGVFTNDAVYLRAWFDDGANGFEHLAPDQRIVAAGYSLMAAAVADGAVTAAKLDSNLLEQIQTAATAGLTVVSAERQDAALLGKGFVPFSSIAAPSWVNGSTTGAPAARHRQAAVWSGAEFLVWGGSLEGGQLSNLGARYLPETDSWTAISPIDAPEARAGHSSVWTGSQMIAWGGASFGAYFNSGGRYSPETQQWVSTTLTGAPEAREGHHAVWTGNRMFIWGGRASSSVLDTGALYDPSANEWTSLSISGQPTARYLSAAAWTGSLFILWGGLGATGELNSGGRLNITSGSTPTAWEATNLAGAPSARHSHTAVWTGLEFIVWGGTQGGVPLATGAAYHPGDDTWTFLPDDGAPSARSGHSAVWTGTEMIIFGGETAGGSTATGAAYNPASGQWRPLTNGGSPVARSGSTAEWTGDEMLVFGGRTNGQVIGALQRVNPQPAWHFFRKL